MGQRIVLFDGECNFCDTSVQFIIKRDPNGYFHFASLQSDVGQSMRKKYNIPENIDSMLLIENEKAYMRSTAALKICRKLTGAWKLFYLFIIIPPPIRNIVYNFVAKNRYKWFGKMDQCMIPPPEIRSRFLS